MGEPETVEVDAVEAGGRLPLAPAGRALPTAWGHSARCSVCAHEQRDEIEALYVGWAPPVVIESAFMLRRGALRRHVAAMGLDAERRGNASAVLGDLLERALGSMDSERKFTLEETLMLVDKLQATGRKRDVYPETPSTAEPEAGAMWDTQVRAFAMRQTRAIPPAK